MNQDLKNSLSEVKKKVFYYIEYVLFNRKRTNWFINYSENINTWTCPDEQFYINVELICKYYRENSDHFAERNNFFYSQGMDYLKNLEIKRTTLVQITQKLENKTSFSSLDSSEEENIRNELKEINEDGCFQEINVYLKEINNFCSEELIPESLKGEKVELTIKKFIFFNFFYYLQHLGHETAESIEELFYNTEEKNKELEKAVSYICDFLLTPFGDEFFQELEQITLLEISSHENKNIKERKLEYIERHKTNFLEKFRTSIVFKQNFVAADWECFYKLFILEFRSERLFSKEDSLKKQKYLFELQQGLLLRFPSFFYLFKEKENRVERELEKINLDKEFFWDTMYKKFDVLVSDFFPSFLSKQLIKNVSSSSVSSSFSKKNDSFYSIFIVFIVVVIIFIVFLVWCEFSVKKNKKKAAPK